MERDPRNICSVIRVAAISFHLHREWPPKLICAPKRAASHWQQWAGKCTQSLSGNWNSETLEEKTTGRIVPLSEQMPSVMTTDILLLSRPCSASGARPWAGIYTASQPKPTPWKYINSGILARNYAVSVHFEKLLWRSKEVYLTAPTSSVDRIAHSLSNSYRDLTCSKLEYSEKKQQQW